VLKNNAALAFKEIVAANGVSNMNPTESGDSRRTPPAEGSAPPPSAPTPPPSPEPAAEP
jgi:hypothetical protein